MSIPDRLPALISAQPSWQSPKTGMSRRTYHAIRGKYPSSQNMQQQPISDPDNTPPSPNQNISIAVMSFNRPHYLEPVLDPIAAQNSLNGRPIFLFQDNSVSPHSGKRHARGQDIASRVEI